MKAKDEYPWMWEIGVDGDRFNRHFKNAGCATAGCVPVTPPRATHSGETDTGACAASECHAARALQFAPDEAHDAAMFRWLVAQSKYAFHCWRLPYFSGDAVSLRAAIASAMAEAMDRLIEDNDE